MSIRLTENDMKELKFRCRVGYILPVMVFILLSLAAISIYEINYNIDSDSLNLQVDLFLLLAVFLFSCWLSYHMNRKYYADIKNKIKVYSKKKIQKKISTVVYEAGSGSGNTLGMKDGMRYDLIVDNILYRIDKPLYEECLVGDTVLLYYAPKSNYLLSIEHG